MAFFFFFKLSLNKGKLIRIPILLIMDIVGEKKGKENEASNEKGCGSFSRARPPAHSSDTCYASDARRGSVPKTAQVSVLFLLGTANQ